MTPATHLSMSTTCQEEGHAFGFISAGARLAASDRNASDTASSNSLEKMEFIGSSP